MKNLKKFQLEEKAQANVKGGDMREWRRKNSDGDDDEKVAIFPDNDSTGDDVDWRSGLV